MPHSERGTGGWLPVGALKTTPMTARRLSSGGATSLACTVIVHRTTSFLTIRPPRFDRLARKMRPLHGLLVRCVASYTTLSHSILAFLEASATPFIEDHPTLANLLNQNDEFPITVVPSLTKNSSYSQRFYANGVTLNSPGSATLCAAPPWEK